MVNLGIIGCGWVVEKAYLPILKNRDDVGIRALFDQKLRKALGYHSN